jgi:hypothetical protein
VTSSDSGRTVTQPTVFLLLRGKRLDLSAKAPKYPLSFWRVTASNAHNGVCPPTIRDEFNVSSLKA